MNCFYFCYDKFSTADAFFLFKYNCRLVSSLHDASLHKCFLMSLAWAQQTLRSVRVHISILFDDHVDCRYLSNIAHFLTLMTIK